MLPSAISSWRLLRSASFRCFAASAAEVLAASLSCANRCFVASTSVRSDMARTEVRMDASSGWLLLTAGWWRGYGGGSVTSLDTSRWCGLRGVVGLDAEAAGRDWWDSRCWCGRGCGVVDCPSFSGGYSSDESRRLLPATAPGASAHWSASRASLGTPMYLDSRLDRSILAPGSPLESVSHQRLAGLPRELPSGLSLTLMLRMGDSDGMKFACCQPAGGGPFGGRRYVCRRGRRAGPRGRGPVAEDGAYGAPVGPAGLRRLRRKLDVADL